MVCIVHIPRLKYLTICLILRYSTIHGGVRIGRLLEDMDIFAVHLGIRIFLTILINIYLHWFKKKNKNFRRSLKLKISWFSIWKMGLMTSKDIMFNKFESNGNNWMLNICRYFSLSSIRQNWCKCWICWGNYSQSFLSWIWWFYNNYINVF